jgi:5-methyltetrahydropteroyltriglutamate--homocysteine methyltransferase
VFARQKVAEVVLLSRALHEGRDAVAGLAVTAGKRRVVRDDRVRARLDALGPDYYRPRPRAACRSGCSA